ncbi:MAG: hypothetical protein HYX67_07905 [Candidatus Melainabacteria bacterium]|nr:hypothetical protein [Candidatus Melainabacteria bacterium]
MKSREWRAWLALLLLAPAFGNGVKAMAAEVWGKAESGMQMSLSGSSGKDLMLSMRNTSTRDQMLSIGMMLAPIMTTTVKGKTTDAPKTQYQYPTTIRLVIQDASGKATEFHIKGPPGVAGFVEPMDIPLPPGATYTFPTLLSECIDAKDFKPVPKGPVQITAKYASKNSDNRANRNYWTGRLESNTISLKL